MALTPARKTYPQLTAATDVQDGDLLASYRSTGPLKKLTALILGNYVVKTATTFLQSLASSVARTPQAKMQDFVSILDIKPTAGSGSGDDAAAFNSATSELASRGGGTLWVPEGDYRVGSQIDVPANVAVEFEAGAVLKPTANFDVIRQHARSTVRAKIDTTLVSGFSSNVLLLDGNDEASAATAFRLHVPTVFDIFVIGDIAATTGTAVKLKCTTTSARIMGVQGNLKQLGLAKGFDLELNAIDGSNFITSCTLTFEASEVLEMIKMNPGSGGFYNIDRMSFYGSSQPRNGTTLPMYTLAGQYNNFNILAWDWDTVAGTAPYAFVIAAGSRESLLQTVVNPLYVDNNSTEPSFVIWNYLSTEGFSAVLTGLVRASTTLGSNLIADVPNSTGGMFLRVNGANTLALSSNRHMEFYGNSGNPATFRNFNGAAQNIDFINATGSLPIYSSVPASATATGVAGQFAADSSFAYFCIAPNTWVRSTAATW